MKRIYVSHPIRGKDGANATDETKAENCKNAIQIANVLRALTPNKEFYVPAEHEDFIGKAYKNGFLTEDQILSIDCQIISKCAAMVVLDFGHISRGMDIEIKFCRVTGIPCIKIDANAILNLEGEIFVSKKKTS
jgi:hypothetical protein